MKPLPKGLKNLWRPGESAQFEYHCWQSKDSQDYEAWKHSQQPVVVQKMIERGFGRSLMERAQNGQPRAYQVRFKDGLKYDVFEDELWTDSKYFIKQFTSPV